MMIQSKVLRANEFCQGNDLHLMKLRRNTSKSFLGNWRNREGCHGPCASFCLLLPSHFALQNLCIYSPTLTNVSLSQWTPFCGMSGNPHDTNAIECPNCGALNPRATAGPVLPSKHRARSLRKEAFELFSPLPRRILPSLRDEATRRRRRELRCQCIQVPTPETHSHHSRPSTNQASQSPTYL